LSSRFDPRDFFESLDKKVKLIYRERNIVCEKGEIKISVEGGFVCRKEINYGNEKSKWLDIYDTYPKYANGKEIIYDFLDEGDITVADAYLNNEIQIERYEPIKVEKITWEEDPYGERYWRFIFYSLRETRHLLYAYTETHDERYRIKLTEIVESFIDDGINKPHAWDDYHAVSFRTMMLTNIWWKLRQNDALSIELNEKILKTIQQHGDFLLDEKHYENKYNHGISQAIALMLAGVSFPDMENAEKWNEVGRKRIVDGIKSLVDNDGVLIENSPYYHFYALEKYWTISKYFSKNNMDIDPQYNEKLDDMISYATYILQPNLEVPLLGASLKRYVGHSGVFREMAKENPEFLYVLTQGREGREPRELNKHYPTTGQVIMRSGWEKKNKFSNEFLKQTQVIFDVGPYRTDHSDLDALSFNLYSNGKTLITDTGLYTYEENDPLKAFFHGTAGHNTVIVDGKDQRAGEPVPGEFKQGDGYVFHSAQHDLYPQVRHQRSIALLDKDAVIIVDNLISDQEHDYEQIFHLFPGAKTEIVDETTVIARGDNGETELTMRQILPGGISVSLPASDEKSGQSICSYEYEKIVPCQAVSYKKHGRNTFFLTLLEVGGSKENVSVEFENENEVKIRTASGSYNLRIDQSDVNFSENTKVMEEIIDEYSLNLISENDGWRLDGVGSEKFTLEENAHGQLAIVPKNSENGVSYFEKRYYIAEVGNLETYFSKNQKLHLDIPFNNSMDSFRMYEQEDFLPILGYHHILSQNQEIKNPRLEMYVSDFEKQIDYMTNVAGCRWFTFGDIMNNYVSKGEKVPRNACVINFDDGRKDHFANGYETFRKYGAVATFYIISERSLSGNSAYMDFSDLDELQRNGNEIGSHTVNAGSLLTEGYSQEELVYQLDESKRMLEEQGYKVTTFAYPRGEQNEEIVGLTSDFYLAGRDTEKDNHWREVRPLTASFDDNFIWHMHYYKPELDSPEDLDKKISYNGWWQFEEGYRIDNDKDGDIKTLSSYIPTNNSYAVVGLDDKGDRVSNKFIVSKDGDYTVEVYSTVNENNVMGYSDVDTLNIYIDGKQQRIGRKLGEECTMYKNQHYCFYNATAYLNKGSHVISIEANQERIKVDKFRMYREIEIKDYYNIKISEQRKVLPEKHSNSKIELTKYDAKFIYLWKYIFIFVAICASGYVLSLKLRKTK
jgi:peptidoglycan/xylan/chitin deacetylase (PgdA/CDA1 family)